MKIQTIEYHEGLMMRLLQFPVWTSLAFLSLLTGALYLSQSGVVEGYVNVRTILLLPITVGHLAIVVGFLRRLASKTQNLGFVFFAVCLILQDISIALTSRVDAFKVEQTKENAIPLIEAIQKFKVEKKSLPQQLSDLSVAIPPLALKNSQFIYKSTGQMFSISFKAPSSLVCSFHSDDSSWKCLD